MIAGYGFWQDGAGPHRSRSDAEGAGVTCARGVKVIFCGLELPQYTAGEFSGSSAQRSEANTLRQALEKLTGELALKPCNDTC